jgi:hypothetical protein
MKRKVLLSTMLVLLFGLLTFSLAAADAHEAQVTVIHGIPGADFDLDPKLPVDVCVNGAALIAGFEYRDQVGPVAIAAGTYDIAIQLAEGIAAGDACGGTTVLDLPGVEVPGNVNLSIIAHRTGDGSPGAGDVLSLGITASIVVNDVSDIVAGKARLTVRHTALAPAVDIPLYRGWRGGRPIMTIPDLENPDEAGPLDVRPGGYFFSIDVDGLGTVYGPEFLELPEPHTSYIIYAVGSYPDTFELLLQTLELEKVPPSRVMP